jgi:hypothetical protein
VADQFDVFKKEIEEDLQRDRALKFWEQYGTYVIAGVVALILGVAGYKYNQNRALAAAEANGKALQVAMKAVADKQPTGEAQLAALASSPGGTGALARLRLAAVHVEAGAKDKAIAVYDALARDATVDKLLSDFAALQAGLLKMDTADWTDARTRLNEVAGDQNPWRHQAREALGLGALKAGQTAEAREVLQKVLTDAAAPRGLQERVQIMLAEIAQAELAKAAPAAPVAGQAPASPAGDKTKAATPPIKK